MGKNVTLRLDESVLRKAKHAAVEREQSLSEWVAGLIAQAVSKVDRLFTVREKALKRMHRGFHLGGTPLSREEVQNKFFELGSKVLPEQRLMKIVEKIDRWELVDDVSSIVPMLRSEKQQITRPSGPCDLSQGAS